MRRTHAITSIAMVVVVFLALGSGVALAYGTGYRSGWCSDPGAGQEPRTAAAQYYPGGTPTQASSTGTTTQPTEVVPYMMGATMALLGGLMTRWHARLLLAAALAGVLAMGGGCSEAREATTTESTGTKATAVSATTSTKAEHSLTATAFAPVTWSPAEKLSPELEQAFTAVLQKAGVVTLFPTTPPPLPGQASGQFSFESVSLVVVRTPDVNPVVGLFSTRAGGSSVAEEIAAAGATVKPIKVRGRDGWWREGRPNGTVLGWEEFGRHFLAEADGLDADSLVQWLATWRPLPVPIG